MNISNTSTNDSFSSNSKSNYSLQAVRNKFVNEVKTPSKNQSFNINTAIDRVKDRIKQIEECTNIDKRIIALAARQVRRLENLEALQNDKAIKIKGVLGWGTGCYNAPNLNSGTGKTNGQLSEFDTVVYEKAGETYSLELDSALEKQDSLLLTSIQKPTLRATDLSFQGIQTQTSPNSVLTSSMFHGEKFTGSNPLNTCNKNEQTDQLLLYFNYIQSSANKAENSATTSATTSANPVNIKTISNRIRSSKVFEATATPENEGAKYNLQYIR